MSKYDYSPDMAKTGIDYNEVVTVPDQVLTMYDIYMKYAVRGEISGLANNIRPHTHDELDLFSEEVDFVPEEDVDILQYSRSIRMAKEAVASSKGQSGQEDKPQDPAGSVAKPQEPVVKEPEGDPGSE